MLDGAAFGDPSGPRDQLATAIRAHSGHRNGARLAESALVRADKGFTVELERRPAAFAPGSHLESHQDGCALRTLRGAAYRIALKTAGEAPTGARRWSGRGSWAGGNAILAYWRAPASFKRMLRSGPTASDTNEIGNEQATITRSMPTATPA